MYYCYTDNPSLKLIQNQKIYIEKGKSRDQKTGNELSDIEFWISPSYIILKNGEVS